MNRTRSTIRLSWPSVIVACAVLGACEPTGDERVPRVVEPRCEQSNAPADGELVPPTLTESSSFWQHAGCNAESTTRYNATVGVRRPDGSIDPLDFVVERRIFSSRYPHDNGSVCRFFIDTRVWQEKRDARIEVPVAPAEVTLCGARITSPHATALVAAGARATLERVDVGAAPVGGPVELDVLLGEPLELAITADPAETPCGDDGDVTARIDRYAFAHRVVLDVPFADAVRLAWDSALELDFAVRSPLDD